MYQVIDNKLYERIDYTKRLSTLTEVGKSYLPRSGRLKQALLEAGANCEVCGSPENLQAHHIEPCKYLKHPKGYKYQDSKSNHKLSNGQLLCRSCHRLLHTRRP